jgi:GH18 family chitinase
MKLVKLLTATALLLSVMHTSQAQFRVIGYIFSRGNIVADLKQVDLDKLTHLNIAFINPDTTGVFKPIPALDTVVQIAHQHNVKVMMSCGGGSRHVYYARLLSDAYRPQVVSNFIAFLDKYNLDGIDVDIEGDDIDDNYENFVVALSNPLHQRGKLLTAALAYYTRNRISDRALSQFDFVNLMAYDKTGPWRPSAPGQHSPMSYVTDHLDYWSKERNMPKEKLVVGVPFYGYGFGPLADTSKRYQSMSYKDIIAAFPGAAAQDEMALPNNGGTIYYNGMPTIKAKTEVAMQRGSGVMIWQLLADTNNDTSLLNVISQTIRKQP